MSTVMRGEMIDDGKGGFIVESQGANGVITSRSFTNRKAADLELQRIGRQAEINQVELGELYQQNVGEFDKQLQEACRRVAAKHGWEPVEVYKVYETIMHQRFGKETTPLQDTQKAIYNKIIDEMGDYTPSSKVTDNIRGAINEKYDVDIDQAIRKDQDRRTQSEQSAIDEYITEPLAQARAFVLRRRS